MSSKSKRLILKATHEMNTQLLRPLLTCYAELAMECGKALGEIASSPCACCMKAERAQILAQGLLQLTKNHTAVFQKADDKLDKKA